jgi:hypothetical protein
MARSIIRAQDPSNVLDPGKVFDGQNFKGRNSVIPLG